MVLAELEIHHSRPIAPTRRVALGRRELPFDPAPGYGSVLLGGIVARFVGALDPDLLGELEVLMRQLETGRRITQPRLRHRFQVDRVGLLRSRHLLVREDGAVRFDLEVDRGSAAQYVLGSVYAAGEAPAPVRPIVMDTLRRALLWRGEVDAVLAAHLVTGGRVGQSITAADPVGWALGVLGFGGAPATVHPGRAEVLARYRDLLRDAHPDLGGAVSGAADRIADLSAARRILLERAG